MVFLGAFVVFAAFGLVFAGVSVFFFAGSASVFAGALPLTTFERADFRWAALLSWMM